MTVSILCFLSFFSSKSLWIFLSNAELLVSFSNILYLFLLSYSSITISSSYGSSITVECGFSNKDSLQEVIALGATPKHTKASYPTPINKEHNTILKSKLSPFYQSNTLDGEGI